MEKRKAKIINLILFSFEIIIFLFIFIDYSFIKEIPNCSSEESGKNTLSHMELENNSFIITIEGTSMTEIKNNSKCLCTKKDNYSMKDIVIFPFTAGANRFIIINRIIGINEEERSFLTKGDTNNINESFLVPEKFIICSIEKKHRINFYGLNN